MRIRDTVIENDKTLGDSGTETIDINLTDPITELAIKMKATNYATVDNVDSPIAKCISKIELVDGSDVLFSLSGSLAQASFLYDTGKLPFRALQTAHAYEQHDHFPIRFGRHLYDQEMAFNPKAFQNPQLKVTWNLGAVNTVDSDGYAAGTARLSVIARVMEESPAPAGFLMSKEVQNWTTAAGGDERINMPVDYPYRRLIVRAFESNVEILTSITNLKLSVEGDRYVVFNLTPLQVIEMMIANYGKVTLEQKDFAGNADVRESWLGWDERAQACAADVGIIVSVWQAWKGRIVYLVINHDGTTPLDQIINLSVRGTCYENTLAYPFGRPNDPATWLQAQAHRNIQLFVTQGDGGAAASVVVQQYRPY